MISIARLLEQIKGELTPNRGARRDYPSSRYAFHEVGFHGDQYLLRLVDVISERCSFFIETGTNVGSTLAYVARTCDFVQCLSCEPDPRAFRHAVRNTEAWPSVSVYNETSQRFLERLRTQYSHLFKEPVLFWLDAHGYGFEWALKREIAFVTTEFDRAYILIDDFKVPGLDCFGYDAYDDQECSYEYIKGALNPRRQYTLCYPNHANRTSAHHPLRGWGLVVFGHCDGLELPTSLLGKVRCEEVARL